MTALAGTFSCLFGFEEADYSQNECACVLLHMRGINTVGCDVSGLLKRKRCRPASARNHVFCSSEPKTYTHTHPAKQTHTSTLFLLQKINLYYCLVCLRRTSFQWFVGFYVVSQIEKKQQKNKKHIHLFHNHPHSSSLLTVNTSSSLFVYLALCKWGLIFVTIRFDTVCVYSSTLWGCKSPRFTD